MGREWYIKAVFKYIGVREGVYLISIIPPPFELSPETALAAKANDFRIYICRGFLIKKRKTTRTYNICNCFLQCCIRLWARSIQTSKRQNRSGPNLLWQLTRPQERFKDFAREKCQF